MRSRNANRPPIRVGLVSPSLDRGGSERQMLALAALLPRDEFQVEFILLSHEGPGVAEAAASGTPLHLVGLQRSSARGLGRFTDLLHQGLAVVRFIRLVRDARYDVLDAWLFPAYATVGLTRPLTGVRRVVAGRRRLSDYKAEFGLFERALDRISRMTTDATVANSGAVAESVARVEGIMISDIHVIPNGVEQPRNLPKNDREEIRRRWRASPGDIVIGCIANYRKGKGLPDLIDVAGRICHDRSGVKFVLVGDGPLRRSLAELIVALDVVDRVTLVGEVNDARDIVGAFDIVVQASESEGLPNSLLEAAAAGVAIVATDAGGTREVISNGDTGLLVDVGDTVGLERALTELIDDSEKRSSLGDRARRRVVEEFSMERFVSSVAELYRDLTRSVRPTS